VPTFGIHAFVWGPWSNDTAHRSIEQSAALGYELIEIPLLHPESLDVRRITRWLRDAGIGCTTSLALPRDRHLPAYPDRALAFLNVAIDVAAELGSQVLTGCTYCSLGVLTGAPPTEAERRACVEVFGEVARHAETLGMRVGLEPVNRYETYLLNVGDDVLDLIRTVGAQNLFIHFDTYHMNIEERGFGDPIRRAGQYVGYVHMSESDRGILGQGNVGWKAIFEALRDIDYRGPLVLEAFAEINPELAAATCLWRPRGFGPHELASQSIAFLRQQAAAIGLP
jgi:D-psicose/D-tagatose/L-ribulose 3-epimerase